MQNRLKLAALWQGQQTPRQNEITLDIVRPATLRERCQLNTSPRFSNIKLPTLSKTPKNKLTKSESPKNIQLRQKIFEFKPQIWYQTSSQMPQPKLKKVFRSLSPQLEQEFQVKQPVSLKINHQSLAFKRLGYIPAIVESMPIQEPIFQHRNIQYTKSQRNFGLQINSLKDSYDIKLQSGVSYQKDSTTFQSNNVQQQEIQEKPRAKSEFKNKEESSFYEYIDQISVFQESNNLSSFSSIDEVSWNSILDLSSMSNKKQIIKERTNKKQQKLKLKMKNRKRFVICIKPQIYITQFEDQKGCIIDCIPESVQQNFVQKYVDKSQSMISFSSLSLDSISQAVSSNDTKINTAVIHGQITKRQKPTVIENRVDPQESNESFESSVNDTIRIYSNSIDKSQGKLQVSMNLRQRAKKNNKKQEVSRKQSIQDKSRIELKPSPSKQIDKDKSRIQLKPSPSNQKQLQRSFRYNQSPSKQNRTVWKKNIKKVYKQSQNTRRTSERQGLNVLPVTNEEQKQKRISYLEIQRQRMKNPLGKFVINLQSTILNFIQAIQNHEEIYIKRHLTESSEDSESYLSEDIELKPQPKQFKRFLTVSEFQEKSPFKRRFTQLISTDDVESPKIQQLKQAYRQRKKISENRVDYQFESQDISYQYDSELDECKDQMITPQRKNDRIRGNKKLQFGQNAKLSFTQSDTSRDFLKRYSNNQKDSESQSQSSDWQEEESSKSEDSDYLSSEYYESSYYSEDESSERKPKKKKRQKSQDKQLIESKKTSLNWQAITKIDNDLEHFYDNQDFCEIYVKFFQKKLKKDIDLKQFEQLAWDIFPINISDEQLKDQMQRFADMCKIDQKAFESWLNKRKFQHLQVMHPSNYFQLIQDEYEQQDIDILHPAENKRHNIRQIHKKRILNQKRQNRKQGPQNKLYGKPLISFSNILFKYNTIKQRIKGEDVIKSGGALEVKDDIEYNERLYCRFRNEFDLSRMSRPSQNLNIASSIKSSNYLLDSVSL